MQYGTMFGEFLIWRSCAKLPIRQIKTLTKFSRYIMVVHVRSYMDTKAYNYTVNMYMYYSVLGKFLLPEKHTNKPMQILLQVSAHTYIV